MKCKFCGSVKFIGHQVCHMDILVDDSGAFLDNMPGDVASAIYESNTPFGPFQCCGCGAVYDELEDGIQEESGPIDGWKFKDGACDSELRGIIELTLIRERTCENEIWANQLFVLVDKPAFQESSSHFESTEKFVMQVLRSRIRAWLSTPDGWRNNCCASQDYNWGDLFNDCPSEQIQAYFSGDEVNGYKVLDSVCVRVNQDELLAPDDVPAILVLEYPDGRTEETEIIVDFQNGDVFCNTPFDETKIKKAHIRTADNAELECSPEDGFLSLAVV